MLWSTTGGTCRRDLKVPIAPMGKLLTRSCFDFRLRNCERRFGQLQAVRAAETSKIPIAPMGDSCFARFYRAAVSLSLPAPSQ